MVPSRRARLERFHPENVRVLAETVESVLGPRTELLDFEKGLEAILSAVIRYRDGMQYDRQFKPEEDAVRVEARRRLKSALVGAQKTRKKIIGYLDELQCGIYAHANDEEITLLLNGHLNTSSIDKLVEKMIAELEALERRQPYKLRRDQLWAVFADVYEALTGMEARKGIAKADGHQPKGPFISFVLAINKLMRMEATPNSIEIWHRRSLAQD